MIESVLELVLLAILMASTALFTYSVVEFRNIGKKSENSSKVISELHDLAIAENFTPEQLESLYEIVLKK